MKRCNYLFSLLAGAGILLSSCNQDREILKELSGQDTGITFENRLQPTEDLNILDYLYFYNGGGVAVGDINNDGLADIYFSGNQTPNKLYINKGDMTFEDITAAAGVAGQSDWNTGSVMADVNGDGYLDIYVCAVVGLKGLRGHNELFINNGDHTFTEAATQYGLDLDTYSSNAAFFDYDLDGDLDMYLLNHAVHTQEAFGNADLRNERSYESGDRLFRNDGDIFTDVSEQAGIYGGVNGYGLGLAISDFNQDGYPDIYVGNDFHEDDYYYLNRGDGTFQEAMKDHFRHISRFSMGNDVADLNHDGYPDLLSLDMLPEDEKVLKSSVGDDDVQMLELRTEKLGYHYQYARNMLHINRGGSHFSEQALMSGIAATDWSWSALFADFDHDMEQDVYIANGIPKRPNDLDYIKFVSSEQIRQKISKTNLVDEQALELMPSGMVPNQIYQGHADLAFENQTGVWTRNTPVITTAIAAGDLDNDGDLDLVLNNIDHEALILENRINNIQDKNYLTVSFRYRGKNPFGTGTRVYAWVNHRLLFKELHPARGFQASSQPMLHFGVGNHQTIDSLRIIWPDKTSQLMTRVAANQHLQIEPDAPAAVEPQAITGINRKPLFTKAPSNLGIAFVHKEDNYVDFNSQKLIPYRISDRGPAVATGDLNGDGLEDLYFGSSRFTPQQLYLQTSGGYIPYSPQNIVKDSVNEEVAAVITDLDNDSRNDLYTGTAGGNFYGKSAPLKDRLFLNSNTGYQDTDLPETYTNTSVIAPCDFDRDGDIDIFTGNQAITYDYGNIPDSYLLENNKGTFKVTEPNLFASAGMITDAIWYDHDQDGWPDLLVVGEWMEPKLFLNDQGTLRSAPLLEQPLKGLWQKIHPFDIDADGDMDLLLANWGTNTKFKASERHPMTMHYGDLDGNGATETVVSIAKEGKYYPLETYDELASQMNQLIRKSFPDYSSFAGKTTSEIFGDDLLNKAALLEVNELRSGYLLNESGSYRFVPFPSSLQASPLTAFTTFDFDNDGRDEVLAGGNYFGVKPFQGRFDGFDGMLIKNTSDYIATFELGLDLSGKSVRHLNIIELNEQPYLLVTINNGPAEVYQLNELTP